MAEPRRSNSITEDRSRQPRTTTAEPRDEDGSGDVGFNNDLQLVSRLVRGDTNAWREFIESYQCLVFSRVRRTMSQFGQQDHSLAEDLCAEVFALMLSDTYAQLRRFEGRSRLSTWLDVLVRRICIRKLKQLQTASKRHASSEHLETVTGSTGPDFVISCDQQIIDTAMQQLGDADEHVLRLFYFEQKSYIEIADSMGLSVNSVGPKLKRAQQRLKKVLRTKGQPHKP